MTYLDERAKPYVEPLAKDLQAPIFMRFNVDLEGQTEKVVERIEKELGELDILLHSIAFSPKEALHGRVIDVGRDGFLKTMDVSCWSFIRMAHLAEPLMKNGGTMFTMTYYGSQSDRALQCHGGCESGDGSCRPLYRRRGRPQRYQSSRDLAGTATRAALGIPEFDELLERAQRKAPARHLVSGGLRRYKLSEIHYFKTNTVRHHHSSYLSTPQQQGV